MPNVSSFGAQTDNAVVSGTVTDRQMIIPEVPPQGLMSVGPRVTPNFVKEPWSKLRSYNFFDVVKDVAGSSYIAIKPVVPTNTELTDEEFWFKWTDPDAQLNELQEIVKLYDGRIKIAENGVEGNKARLNELEKTVKLYDGRIKIAENGVEGNKARLNELEKTVYDGIYLCLGDSWVAGGEIAGTVAKQKNLKLVNKAVSGGSFTKFTSYVKTVDEEIDDAVSAIADPNDVKLVTLVCSVNDVTHTKQSTSTQDEINTAAALALRKIRAKFPKAEIVFAADAPYSAESLSLSYYYYSVGQMQRVAFNNDVTFINLCNMFNNKDFYVADNLHPNTEGYGFIASALLKGSYHLINRESYTNGSDSMNIFYDGTQVIINYTFAAGSKRDWKLPRNLALITMLNVPRTGSSVTLTKKGDTRSNYADTLEIPTSSEKLYGFIICSTDALAV